MCDRRPQNADLTVGLWLPRAVSADVIHPARRGGFQPRTDGLEIRQQPAVRKPVATTSDNDNSVLGSCLAKIRQNRPDWAAVMKAWDRLPDAVKEGILAMVHAVPASEANGTTCENARQRHFSRFRKLHQSAS